MAKKASQPELNIGLFGHVDHGKTTLVKALSGKWTDTHSEEIKRGITIRLGYADATFYKYKGGYGISEKGPKGEKGTLVRAVSLIDAPGHESLMATMLAGATIIDGAILMVSAREKCPQPQTREHIMALEIMGVDKVIVVQNKIDLVSEEQALKNYKQIKEFLGTTKFKDAPIVPTSARHNINVDVLIETIEKLMPTPKRDLKADPILLVARSFDINKPGSVWKDLKGGILGGALIQGVIKVDDELEIRPGYAVEEKNKKVWKPLKTKVVSLVTGGSPVKEIKPGGSVAIMTSLDPAVVKSDKLAGSLAGTKKLPEVLYTVTLKANLLDRVVGTKEDLDVEPLRNKEILMLNVNSAATVGVVTNLGKGKVTCTLKLPICAAPGDRVTISRRLGNRFRLIGYGIIQ
ncbi:MAG: translation initiation factor IF-2 subunit gamma [Candidatus Nanoarchaeia archaeon]